MSESRILSLEEILLKNGALRDADLERARKAIDSYGGHLEDVLLGQGSCSEEDILVANAELYDIQTYADWLARFKRDRINEVADDYGLDKKWWEEQQAFPLAEIDGVI